MGGWVGGWVTWVVLWGVRHAEEELPRTPVHHSKLNSLFLWVDEVGRYVGGGWMR